MSAVCFEMFLTAEMSENNPTSRPLAAFVYPLEVLNISCSAV